ncbi:MAG TPA: COX15/CtaA family protein [Myxococcota bacterium]|jgi:cytochrome c oxidase assembly protein subunit 15
MSTDAASRKRANALARACFAFNGLVLANIALGALVRAHGAGLACPDWPLCFGDAIPQFDFKVAWEVGHRYVVALLSTAFAALGVAVLAHAELRRVAGKIWTVGLALLVLQVLLGATTVWFQLAAWSVTSHLIVGNAWNASVLWLGLTLRAHARGAARAALPRRLRLAVALAALFLFFQIALGGLVSSRAAGLACSQWPSCYGDAWFPVWGMTNPIGLHVHHRANAYLLAGLATWMAFSARGEPRLERPALLALALVFVQIAIGIANVLLQLRVEITALHTAMAGMLVLVLTACAHAAFAEESR